MYAPSTTAATSPTIHLPPARRSKRSSSLSASSVVTVKRSASIGPRSQPRSPIDGTADPGSAARAPLSPTKRRRSSVAHVAIDSVSGLREGISHLNRWSQSTSSSKSSSKERRRSSFARRLSIGGGAASTTIALHGSDAPPSPRLANGPPFLRKDSTPSPHRLPSRGSPAPARSAPAPPPLMLPILSAAAYDPTSASTSGSATPSTSGLFTPSTSSVSGPDYFALKTQPSGSTSRSPVAPRGKAARSPLGLQQPAEIQSRPPARAGGASHSNQSSESSLQSFRKGHQPKQHSGSASNDSSKDVARSRARSISDASSKLDDGNTSTPPRTRERRERDKKSMLSKALQKANTAVLLDNASNFEGAKDAYSDACRLLQQVMARSPAEEDKRKLEAIRTTYTGRIKELEQLDQSYPSAPGKSLPARPMSDESIGTSPRSGDSGLSDDDDEPAIIQTATMTRIVNDRSIDSEIERARQGSSPPPMIRESVIASAIRDVESIMPDDSETAFHLGPSSTDTAGAGKRRSSRTLAPPMERTYMPPPLSPRRPSSPANLDESSEPDPRPEPHAPAPTHTRGDSSESMSWLDPPDESGGSSCSSSMHSVSSQNGLHRRHLRAASGATEADFDAALDAAVEAAYGDGLEPEDETDAPIRQSIVVANALRNVERAKERVREVEREEAVRAAKAHERERLLRGEALPLVRDSVDLEYHGEEAEEEERLLDEMTKEYMLDGFDFGLQSKSALPRQSDSSGFSGTTWHSSTSSTRTTPGTSLSTVAEAPLPATRFSPNGPSKPPPVTPSAAPLAPVSESLSAGPSPTTTVAGAPPSGLTGRGSNIQNRRSFQNPKQLKIETSVKPVTSQRSPQPTTVTRADASPHPPRSSSAVGGMPPDGASRPPAAAPSSGHLRVGSPPPHATSPADTNDSPSTPALKRVASADSGTPISPGGTKLSTRLPAGDLRKNKSSLSLKNRAMSVSSPDGSDGSVGTPMSTTFNFSNHGRKPTLGGLGTAQTPSAAIFGTDNMPTGGMHLFESDIHSAHNIDSPNPLTVDAPIPLEPCPDSFLLRPFWLMRCFYQTIAHPRGGYLSTKLFIPRDVWSVKGVKLKALDEKIANCDLLTAALQKLANVDTYDADAVLEEMQALEPVLDQVQTAFVKKLGSEVGLNGISALFKDSPNLGNADTTVGGGELPPPAKGAASQSKSYLSSWRKLRSKNSSAGLPANLLAVKEVTKDSLVLSTLPMTTLPNIRFAKRDVSQLEVAGPNAHYMGALARLFDAVQVIDQIARQVEDPGLKLSSPTHVGLELSTRHAAEFFGFFVCRFVLTDISMMMDKFLKRSSEWTLL